MSGCWYPRQQTWPLLTLHCLTLPRNNPHPTVSLKSHQPSPSQPLCPPTPPHSLPNPYCHLQASNLQCLCVLRYPWTAGYSGHVEHGINAGSHPCDFPYLHPTTTPHSPSPAEACMQAGSGVLPSLKSQSLENILLCHKRLGKWYQELWENWWSTGVTPGQPRLICFRELRMRLIPN